MYFNLPKSCLHLCKQGSCLFQGCSYTRCPGGACHFIDCKYPSCSGKFIFLVRYALHIILKLFCFFIVPEGGACVFERCTGATCDGGRWLINESLFYLITFFMSTTFSPCTSAAHFEIPAKRSKLAIATVAIAILKVRLTPTYDHILLFK